MGKRKAKPPFVPDIIVELGAEPTSQEIIRLDGILGMIVNELIEHGRRSSRRTKPCQGEIVETDSHPSPRRK